MFPARSRLICTGTSTRSPAAGPPSTRIRIVNGDVSTVAGLRYDTAGGGDFTGIPQAPGEAGSLFANAIDKLPCASTYTARYFPNGSRITSWLPGIPRLLFPTAESLATSKILVGADPSGDIKSKLTMEIVSERNADRPAPWPIVRLAGGRGTAPYLGDGSTHAKSRATCKTYEHKENPGFYGETGSFRRRRCRRRNHSRRYSTTMRDDVHFDHQVTFESTAFKEDATIVE